MTSGHLWKTTHLVSKQKVMTLKRARERKLVGDLISNLECTTFFWWSKEVVSSTFLQIFFPLTMRKTELAIHSFSLWLCRAAQFLLLLCKAIVVLFQFLWFLNFEIPLNHLMVWVTPADPQHVLNMRPRSSSFLQNVISLNCHLRVKLLTYSHPIFEFFSCLFKNDESMTQELNISDEHIKYVSKTPSILFTKSFTFNDQMKLQRSITIFLSSKNPLFIQKLASSSIKCSSA